MKQIDTRGLSCPQPVVLVNRAIKEGGDFEVLLDSEVSRENVLRLLKRNGLKSEEKASGEEFTLRVTR